MPRAPLVPLPRGWPAHTRSALLHALGLAHFALVHVRGWCANSPIARVRLAAESERLRSEVALLREELRIKDARLACIAPRERPHYPPPERLAILALRGARAWSAAETARRFLLTGPTIASWMRRLDEAGPDALVQLSEPANRFPDFVRILVQNLRATLPMMGKVRIAQMLARAGLHLAPTTVRRFVRDEPPRSPTPTPRPTPSARLEPCRVVAARYPHHVWHVDLTIVPTTSGFWVPWLPPSVAQRWPFAWWVGVVMDHFCRVVVAEAVFDKEPTATEVCAMLGDAVARAGRAPRHIVSDQGCQLQDEYRAWCAHYEVKPRFGAIGQSGSIAVIERFMRSMKNEALRRILVPLSWSAMRAEVAAYASWYGTHRPHQGLGGATPNEVLAGAQPARERVRLETRRRMPIARGDPDVRRPMHELELVVDPHEGREHLPIVELREAA